jgi:hypothetical protein
MATAMSTCTLYHSRQLRYARCGRIIRIVKEGLTLLVASPGSHFSLMASLPYSLKTVLTRVLCTSTMTATEASTLASSSTAMMAEVNEHSDPDRSAGVSIPISYWSARSCAAMEAWNKKLTPFSKRPLMISGSICSFSSISLTLGPMTSSAYRFTAHQLSSDRYRCKLTSLSDHFLLLGKVPQT